MPKDRTSLEEMLANWDIENDSLVALKLEKLREAILVKQRLDRDLANQKSRHAFLIACGAGDASERQVEFHISQIHRDVGDANMNLVDKVNDLAQALIADDEYWARWPRPHHPEVEKTRARVMGQQALWFACECGFDDPSLLSLARGRIAYMQLREEA